MSTTPPELIQPASAGPAQVPIAAAPAAQVPPVVVADFVDEDGDAYGFPAGKPLSELSVDQQKEYWRHKARKHERDVKQLRAQTQPAAPAQTPAAAQPADRDAIRQELQRESGERSVSAVVRAMVAMGRLTHEQSASLLDGMNRSAFLDASGEVDHDKLSTYLNLTAPPAGMAPGQSQRDPNQGNRQRVVTSRAEQGKAEAARRFVKSSGN